MLPSELEESNRRFKKLKRESLTKQDVVATQKYSNIERAEMLISFGRALGKSELAQELYIKKHSGKPWFSGIPEVKIFPTLYKFLSRYGDFNYTFETDDEQESCETSNESSDEEDFDETLSESLSASEPVE